MKNKRKISCSSCNQYSKKLMEIQETDSDGKWTEPICIGCFIERFVMGRNWVISIKVKRGEKKEKE